MIKGLEKIQMRISKYEQAKEKILEQYAEDPSMKKYLDETDTILSTLQFCLNCLESEAE